MWKGKWHIIHRSVSISSSLCVTECFSACRSVRFSPDPGSVLPLALSAASPVLSPHCTCAWLVTSPIAQTIVLHSSKDQLSCKSGCLKFNVFLCVSEFLQKCDHSFAKSVTWFMSLLLFCLHSAVFTIVCLVFSPNRISPPTSLTLRECVCLLTFGFRATASLLLNIYSAQSGIEAQNNS